MKPEDADRLEAMSRRNEADMRLVQALVGMAVGAVVGFAIIYRVLGPHRHHHGLLDAGLAFRLALLGGFLGALAGAAIGYFKDTWRSGL